MRGTLDGCAGGDPAGRGARLARRGERALRRGPWRAGGRIGGRVPRDRRGPVEGPRWLDSPEERSSREGRELRAVRWGGIRPPARGGVPGHMVALVRRVAGLNRRFLWNFGRRRVDTHAPWSTRSA